jgi:hypothetical protein
VGFGPKAKPFSPPWAEPGESRNDMNVHRPNGPTVLRANGWPVDPKPAVAIFVPLGVAQGWEKGCPFGARTSMAESIGVP